MKLETKQDRKDFVLNEKLKSKCKRKQVAAVITDSDNFGVLAYSYNRAPNILPDCHEVGCNSDCVCDNTLHAEIRACLVYQYTHGPKTLTTSLFPCKICAKVIIFSGIKKVEYVEDYRDMSAIELFKQAGVEVEKI
jgi:dCMP deaminase